MPKAKFIVLCDFNQDGDFVDANEDITGDMTEFTITHGKNIPKQRAEAGVLDLVLKNADHKYSPSKTSSALYPNVIPAPPIWVLGGYPVDDFNVADATTLSGRKPSHDDKFAAWGGDVSNFNVLANTLRTPVAGNYTATLDFGETDCFVGAKFTRGGAGSGLVLRWTDASNFFLVRVDTTAIYLTKVNAGVASTVSSVQFTDASAAAGAYTWAAGSQKWLFAEMHGNTFRVWVDDVLQFSATDSFNNTATKHGLGGRSSHVDDRWDDFGGWRSLFYGRIDSILPRPELNRKYCYVRAFDDTERLGQHLVYSTAPAAPVTAKNVLDAILDAVDDTAAVLRRPTTRTKQNRVFDTGTTLTTDALHENVLGRSAITELYQVQDDDVGFFHIDGSGLYRYEESGHRETAPHDKAIKTWRHNRQNNDETDLYLTGLEWDDGKDRVENEIYFIYHKVSRTSTIQVWRLNVDDKPAIKGGETLDFLAVGEGDVIASPVTPVATTDYTVNTLENGTGTDLTASITASLVAGWSGNFRLVRLVLSGTTNGFVTFLQLRAIKGTKVNATAARAEDTGSQIALGRRRTEHTTLHIDEYTSALNRAKKRLVQRSLPREVLTVTMPNGTRDNLMQIFHRSISDRIHVIFTDMGITDSYHIERQTIKVTEGGLLVSCEWELQQGGSGGWGFIRWNQFQWA